MPTTAAATLNPDRDLYWQHNSHWSIRGEHLVGLLVSRYILEHRLVQVPDREAKLGQIEAKIEEIHRSNEAEWRNWGRSWRLSVTPPQTIYFQTPSISAWHLGHSRP